LDYLHFLLIKLQLYLTFLAAVPFLPVVSPRFTAIHLNIILLVSFTVYVYRDLWPLATFNLVPQDEGRLLWAKIGVLAVASVLLPLATPQAYIPVDVTVNISRLLGFDLK
jgi:hypothetical protein